MTSIKDRMTLQITVSRDSAQIVSAEARFNNMPVKSWESTDRGRVMLEYAIACGIAKLAWGDNFESTILPDVQS